MALVLHWYDCFIFSFVLGAVATSIWMIWKSECRRTRPSNSKYESLLTVAALNGRAKLASSRHVSTDQLWTSCWRGLHPTWLLLFRFIVVVVMVGILSSDIVAYDFSIFIYYTEWTFALVIVYFAIGTVISAHGCWRYWKGYNMEVEEANGLLKSDEQNGAESVAIRTNKDREDAARLQDDSDPESSDEKRAGFWGHLMLVLYQTCAGGVMLTDIVFWTVLVPFLKSNHFTVNLIMSCMHSLNAVFLLFDTALNNLPLPWFGMAYFVLWSCIYVSFQWILHACGFSWWPYPFLELGTPWAIAWYLGMALVHVPCYGLYWLVVRAKNTFLPRLFPSAYCSRW